MGNSHCVKEGTHQIEHFKLFAYKKAYKKEGGGAPQDPLAPSTHKTQLAKNYGRGVKSSTIPFIINERKSFYMCFWKK